MKLVLIFSSVFLASVFSSPVKEGRRLIKTSEKDAGVWMSEAEIWELIMKEKNFIDVTDHNYPQVQPQDVYTKAIPSAPRYQTAVRSALTHLNQTRVEDFVTHFSSYHNRYYTATTGIESQQWLVNQIRESLSLYAGSYEINEISHTWQQKSIVARILGSDPMVGSEIVIIGAHEDSINRLGGSLNAPGADDNASGSVLVLETLRALIATGFFPKRTIEFHWYAAEEVGLRGSGDIARSYSLQGRVVAGMANFDVVGYPTQQSIGIFTDYTNAALNAFLRLVVDEYCEWGWSNQACGYGCSDHASWTNYGFAAAMPSEVVAHPQMHTVNDVIGAMNFVQVMEFIKLSVGFVIEMAEPAI